MGQQHLSCESEAATARWNGRKYVVVYRATGPDTPKGAVSYLVMDKTGDGWKDIVLVLTPETGDVGVFSFNGREAMMQ